MKNTDSDFIEVSALRPGMFVELDLGWMAHPFSSSSFKISSVKQIDTIHSLGLTRVRYVPSKSDPEPVDARSTLLDATQQPDSKNDLQQLQRQQRADAVRLQGASLARCEQRFSDAVLQYRKTMELVQSDPGAAGQAAGSVIGGFVTDLMAHGDSALRLLSGAPGDKAAMHPVNVTVVSLLLGRAMGLHQSELTDLGLAAFLHDVGKLGLPDRVRWAEDNFSTAESRMYQEHVAQSVQYTRGMNLSKQSQLAIAQHHEHADGSGFPLRIKGESMSIGARILALVNHYEGLCNPNRPASALTPHESLSLIFAQQKNRYDPVALSAFIRMMGVYPPGSLVQLIDDRQAMVVSVNSMRPLKPRVIVHEPGIPKHEALILDLEKVPQIAIRRSLKPSSLSPEAYDYLAPRPRINYFFEEPQQLHEEEALT
jgi:HD-GYP domain-containing protein (c-di-GMP phosphodiesterase class II)